MVGTKECRVCLKVLPLSLFYKDVRYVTGHKHLCKVCQNEARNKRRVARKEWIQSVKVERGCSDCGYNSHPEALHFDHLPEHKKEYAIATLADSAVSKYLDEIEKCEVVCANCHAIRTYNRRDRVE